MKKRKPLKVRSPIAENMHKFNKPSVVQAKKGKGSYKRNAKRNRKVDDRTSKE